LLSLWVGVGCRGLFLNIRSFRREGVVFFLTNAVINQ